MGTECNWKNAFRRRGKNVHWTQISKANSFIHFGQEIEVNSHPQKATKNYNLRVWLKPKQVKELLAMAFTTDLPETERQKTPGSLYHIQQKQIASVNWEDKKYKHMDHVAHRSDLLLLNMVQRAWSFLYFCFWQICR